VTHYIIEISSTAAQRYKQVAHMSLTNPHVEHAGRAASWQMAKF